MKLKEKLVTLKHRSKALTYLWYMFRKPLFSYRNKKIMYCSKKRELGFLDKRYEAIKNLKGIYNNKRCFIVATGPSLTLNDLNLLKNEVTFGMNSVCKLFDKTDWRPTYYGIQDCYVYNSMQKDIEHWYGKKASNVFVADRICDKYIIHDNYIQFPLNSVYHENEMEIDNYFSRFSDDAYAIVYDGYSITYSLIQIAIYMGFTEIYLTGADCSYKKGVNNHVVESGFVDKNEEKNHDKMITGYKAAKEYADSNGIKIINCTRGGMLEVFPRMSLEEVLGKNV